MAYNVVAIPFAAGIWYPWTHTLVAPQYAGLSMALSSISVVCSSMALRWFKRPIVDSSTSDGAPTSNMAVGDFDTPQGKGLRDKIGSGLKSLGRRIATPSTKNSTYNPLAMDEDLALDTSLHKGDSADVV